MKPRATGERWSGSSAEKNAFVSPLKRDWWVCMPLPFSPCSGLGMKVAYTPLWAATSLVMRRMIITWSAIFRALS